jgi:hypothetical protein
MSDLSDVAIAMLLYQNSILSECESVSDQPQHYLI